jgi:hypothetical protein
MFSRAEYRVDRGTAQFSFSTWGTTRRASRASPPDSGEKFKNYSARSATAGSTVHARRAGR